MTFPQTTEKVSNHRASNDEVSIWLPMCGTVDMLPVYKTVDLIVLAQH